MLERGSRDASSSIANFFLKLYQKIVLNCTAPFRRYSQGHFKANPLPFANFNFTMFSKKIRQIVLQFLNFVLPPSGDISKDAFRASPPLLIFAPKWCEKIVLILC